MVFGLKDDKKVVSITFIVIGMLVLIVGGFIIYQQDKPNITGKVVAINCGDGTCQPTETSTSCPEDCKTDQCRTESQSCLDDSQCCSGLTCKYFGCYPNNLN